MAASQYETSFDIIDEMRTLLPSLSMIDPGRSRLDWHDIEAVLASGLPSAWRPIQYAKSALDGLRRAPTLHQPSRFVELGFSAMALGLPMLVTQFNETALRRLAETRPTQRAADGIVNSLAHEYAANGYAAAGAFSRAIDHFDQALDEDDDSINLRMFRASLLSRMGLYSRAAADVKILRSQIPYNHGIFADLYWRGETAAAVEYFDDLERRSRYALAYKLWGSLMLSDAILGDPERPDARFVQALDYLEAAKAGIDSGGDEVVSWIRISSRFHCPDAVVERLEADERFQRWLTDCGLDHSVRDEFISLVNAESDLTGITIEAAS